MKWGMQVLVNNEWKWIKQSNRTHAPYVYNSEELAHIMLNMCYPDQVREIKLGTSEPKVRVKAWTH